LKATIRHSLADWVMRHRTGEATPEPEHLREGTALCGRNLSGPLAWITTAFICCCSLLRECWVPVGMFRSLRCFFI
jgi:hypothetical protein